MYRDYAPLGVKFHYIYKALAHPEINGYVSPFTIEERLQHVAIAKAQLGSQIDWLCDTMTNDLKHAFGDAPNSEFVIDPAGTVVRKRAWSDPLALRKDLESLVGAVAQPTRVEDLKLPSISPARQAAKEVVPRLRLPGQFAPVVTSPMLTESEVPFYVKLRVEADSDLLRQGKGRLYLGFFLDPIYQVHWNNRAEPMSFEIQAAADTRISPAQGQGPKVSLAADSDPREFVVDVELADRSVPLTVTVRYVACDDAETFCLPVAQSYSITLQADRDGGNRRSAMPAAPPASADMSSRMRQRVLSFDKDHDGIVQLADVPDRMRQFLQAADANHDGAIDGDELRTLRPPPGGPPRPKQKRSPSPPP